jgi:adenine-specific DNA-methyltransferase
MMRARLAVLYRLLAPGGLLWVHLDNCEVHYAKVLLDELFSRACFVAQITYERSGSAGLGQGSLLVNTAEYLLLYRKGPLAGHPLRVARSLDHAAMKRYTRILADPGERRLVREFPSKANGHPVRLYEHSGFRIEAISLRRFEQRRAEIEALYATHFDKIFRTTNPQRENSFQRALIAGMDPGGLYSVEYRPNRGKHKDRHATLYYTNREIFAWLREAAELREGRVVKTSKLTDVWIHGDIPKADLANEGGVEFKRGKKPEHLLRRIIELSTRPGEWVLDAFGGSGTSAAAAHKMGRRWIVIEQGEHCLTRILPRLRRVVAGTDSGGITKAVGWRGGGGFRCYQLDGPRNK